VVFVQKITFFF